MSELAKVLMREFDRQAGPTGILRVDHANFEAVIGPLCARLDEANAMCARLMADAEAQRQLTRKASAGQQSRKTARHTEKASPQTT